MTNPNSGSNPESEDLLLRVNVQGSDSLTAAITRAVAARTNTPVADLPPLHDRIDPAALDSLVDHANRHESPVRVTFRYYGYTVAVTHDCCVQLFEPHSENCVER
ncbi:HalOD1 output domain-containing protein [Natrialba sp. SSL1]|uniref:HalOD1 output domain-containing protein n=1 Tax=Natrialba sp. SSL1 TaxID=1869245 RepID=UPI001495F051|nr:HalOD1 output domain-containing protein [Natrialba sp. SSL1]